MGYSWTRLHYFTRWRPRWRRQRQEEALVGAGAIPFKVCFRDVLSHQGLLFSLQCPCLAILCSPPPSPYIALSLTLLDMTLICTVSTVLFPLFLMPFPALPHTGLPCPTFTVTLVLSIQSVPRFHLAYVTLPWNIYPFPVWSILPLTFPSVALHNTLPSRVFRLTCQVYFLGLILAYTDLPQPTTGPRLLLGVLRYSSFLLIEIVIGFLLYRMEWLFGNEWRKLTIVFTATVSKPSTNVCFRLILRGVNIFILIRIYFIALHGAIFANIMRDMKR